MAIHVLRALGVLNCAEAVLEIAKSTGIKSPLTDETNRVANAALRDYTDQMARAIGVEKPIILAHWDQPECVSRGVDLFSGKAGVLVPRNVFEGRHPRPLGAAGASAGIVDELVPEATAALREKEIRYHKYMIANQISLIKSNSRFYTPLISLIIGVAAFVLLNPVNVVGAIVVGILAKNISCFVLTRFYNLRAEDEALKHAPRDVLLAAREVFQDAAQKALRTLSVPLRGALIFNLILNRSFQARATLIEKSFQREIANEAVAGRVLA